MAFNDSPNRLEAVFVQRTPANDYYAQINISGSDLIVYLDENGLVNADRPLVWAAKYGIGTGGSSISASWASSSLQTISASWASRSLVSGYASSSISSSWASSSFSASFSQYTISASWASASISSSFSLFAFSASMATSASYASGSTTSSYALIAFSASNATSASWASASISASYAPFTPTVQTSCSWASSSITASALQGASAVYAAGLLTSGRVVFMSGNTIQGSSILYDNAVSIGVGGPANVDMLTVTGNIKATVVTASLQGTASWAVSASWAPPVPSSIAVSSSWASASISASYAITSSYALNGGSSGPSTLFTTIVTGSGQWITCSFTNGNETIELSVIQPYSFTQSNIPANGNLGDYTLYISHSASPSTSSLTFPSNWINLGAGWPTYITSSRVAILTLRAYNINNTASIVGAWNGQI